MRSSGQALKQNLPEGTNTEGNCFEVAGRWMLDHGWRKEYRDAVLFHAEIGGQAHLEGWRFWHAWIEHDGVALDYSNGRDLELPVAFFRCLARAGREFRYTMNEAARLMLKSEHFGPWEEESNAGPHQITDGISSHGEGEGS